MFCPCRAFYRSVVSYSAEVRPLRAFDHICDLLCRKGSTLSILVIPAIHEIMGGGGPRGKFHGCWRLGKATGEGAYTVHDVLLRCNTRPKDDPVCGKRTNALVELLRLFVWFSRPFLRVGKLSQFPSFAHSPCTCSQSVALKVLPFISVGHVRYSDSIRIPTCVFKPCPPRGSARL